MTKKIIAFLKKISSLSKLLPVESVIKNNNINKPFFDLGCYRYEIDGMNAIEIDHWYRHKELKSIETIEETRVHFAKDNL